MKLHVPAALLFILAAGLYIAGEHGGGALAAGVAFVLEAKAWSQVFGRAGKSPVSTREPSE